MARLVLTTDCGYEDLHNLRIEFAAAADHDSYVSKERLTEMLLARFPQLERGRVLSDMLRVFDVDSNGKIYFAEFARALAKLVRAPRGVSSRRRSTRTLPRRPTRRRFATPPRDGRSAASPRRRDAAMTLRRRRAAATTLFRCRDAAASPPRHCSAAATPPPRRRRDTVPLPRRRRRAAAASLFRCRDAAAATPPSLPRPAAGRFVRGADVVRFFALR